MRPINPQRKHFEELVATVRKQINQNQPLDAVPGTEDLTNEEFEEVVYHALRGMHYPRPQALERMRMLIGPETGAARADAPRIAGRPAGTNALELRTICTDTAFAKDSESQGVLLTKVAGAVRAQLELDPREYLGPRTVRRILGVLYPEAQFSYEDLLKIERNALLAILQEPIFERFLQLGANPDEVEHLVPAEFSATFQARGAARAAEHIRRWIQTVPRGQMLEGHKKIQLPPIVEFQAYAIATMKRTLQDVETELEARLEDQPPYVFAEAFGFYRANLEHTRAIGPSTAPSDPKEVILFAFGTALLAWTALLQTARAKTSNEVDALLLVERSYAFFPKVASLHTEEFGHLSTHGLLRSLRSSGGGVDKPIGVGNAFGLGDPVGFGVGDQILLAKGLAEDPPRLVPDFRGVEFPPTHRQNRTGCPMLAHMASIAGSPAEEAGLKTRGLSQNGIATLHHWLSRTYRAILERVDEGPPRGALDNADSTSDSTRGA